MSTITTIIKNIIAVLGFLLVATVISCVVAPNKLSHPIILMGWALGIGVINVGLIVCWGSWIFLKIQDHLSTKK